MIGALLLSSHFHTWNLERLSLFLYFLSWCVSMEGDQNVL